MVSEFGHDSQEDALACMKLVWKKIREDAQSYRPRVSSHHYQVVLLKSVSFVTCFGRMFFNIFFPFSSTIKNEKKASRLYCENFETLTWNQILRENNCFNTWQLAKLQLCFFIILLTDEVLLSSHSPLKWTFQENNKKCVPDGWF